MKLKLFKQSKGYCGPASLRMVLSFYGINKSEDYLAKLTKATRKKGCSEKNIVKAAKKLGFEGTVKQKTTIKELKKLVKTSPVIVGWTSPEEGGHYSVVTGFEKNKILLADPHFGKIKKHDIQWFKERWGEVVNKKRLFQEIIVIKKKDEMKIIIPQVKFRIAELQEIIGVINFFLNPKKEGWDWSNSILKRYPKLKEKLDNVRIVEKRKKIANKFFADVQIKEKKELKKAVNKFKKGWNKINDRIMNTLSEVVEIDWPENARIIISKASLNPICPRYIKKRTFDVYYKVSSYRMKEVAIHEILHFIYFEKWKEAFPKTKEKHFDAPYMVWQLSEMVPPVILSDKRVQKVFKHKPLAYKEYELIKIKNRPLLSYIQEFYNKRKNFKDFLKKSYAFVRKHEKIINKPSLEIKRKKNGK